MAFVIVRIDRRDLVWINVIINPTAEWFARPDHRGFFLGDAAAGYMIGKSRSDLWRRSSHADCEPWAFGTSR